MQMSETRQIDEVVADWSARAVPGDDTLQGQYVRVMPLQTEAHAALLFRAYEGHDEVWDYLPYGPFHSAAQYHRWMRQVTSDDSVRFYAFQDIGTGLFGGVASYLRIKPEAGSIEVGHINLSPQLKQSRAATEAFYLMMRWAFETGYRRFEWKCNAQNLASRRAGQRLGLSYEGVFRQAGVVKGRNRDTAWFAAIDKEWPALKTAFDVWLNPANFDAAGRQRESLSDLTRLVRYQDDPLLR
jgi:RimJ/RimL family protein N-acetyltransferase